MCRELSRARLPIPGHSDIPAHFFGSAVPSPPWYPTCNSGFYNYRWKSGHLVSGLPLPGNLPGPVFPSWFSGSPGRFPGTSDPCRLTAVQNPCAQKNDKLPRNLPPPVLQKLPAYPQAGSLCPPSAVSPTPETAVHTRPHQKSPRNCRPLLLCLTYPQRQICIRSQSYCP